MIGYYVHHHGLGHVTRAGMIARHLGAVTGMGSLPAPDGWPGRWLELPPDLSETPLDPTADGVFHWAPLGHVGHRQRLAAITGVLREVDLMVVDVSAEVATLSRLLGVPTVVVAMRGDRSDRPHATAYDSATALLAPWSREHAERWWPERWTRKTSFVGAMSRFDDFPEPTAVRGVRPRVLVLWGAGGSEVPPSALDEARSATPGRDWVWRSPDHPSPDLWGELHAADVVVSHAGNNAVAEVAAARRPAVVIAQARPFAEQHHTVEALRRAGIAVALDSWPDAAEWPGLIERALEAGGSGWGRWNPRDGARRAAGVLRSLGTGA